MNELKVDNFHLIMFKTHEFSFPLFTNETFDSGPKASVLIGPNGTNKSRVLSLLIDELIIINELRSELSSVLRTQEPGLSMVKIRQYDLFPAESRLNHSQNNNNQPELKFHSQIEYRQDGHHWIVERFGTKLKVWKNSKLIDPKSFSFPKRAIAVAHLPTDRFKFSRNEENNFYAYLGLRQATNMTTTGALEIKLVLGLLKAMKRSRALDFFKKWFKELDLSLSVNIEIGLGRRYFLDIENYGEFEKAVRSYSERTSRITRKFNEDSEGKIKKELAELWQFMLMLKKQPLVKRTERARYIPRTYKLEFNLSKLPKFHDEHDISKTILLGRRFGVFSGVTIVFTKLNQQVEFSELSSGEQQILGTIIRFVAELENNSIVIIDEPEVSLHPEWQRMYLPRLIESLETFPQTHVIIATHSHFMISDLSNNFASLTVASNDPKNRFTSYKDEVYGRSPENILYRVFGISTTSNFYVERDLTRALRLISGLDEMDIDELNLIYKRLQVLDVNGNDALIEILARIEIVLNREVFNDKS